VTPRGVFAAVLGADVAVIEGFRFSRQVVATAFGFWAAVNCMAAIVAQRYVAEVDDAAPAAGPRAASASSPRTTSAPSTARACA
jgi:hypothetical protein